MTSVKEVRFFAVSCIEDLKYSLHIEVSKHLEPRRLSTRSKVKRPFSNVETTFVSVPLDKLGLQITSSSKYFVLEIDVQDVGASILVFLLSYIEDVKF